MPSINCGIIFIFTDVIKSLFLVIMIDHDYEIVVITSLSKNFLVESSNAIILRGFLTMGISIWWVFDQIIPGRLIEIELHKLCWLCITSNARVEECENWKLLFLFLLYHFCFIILVEIDGSNYEENHTSSVNWRLLSFIMWKLCAVLQAVRVNEICFSVLSQNHTTY